MDDDTPLASLSLTHVHYDAADPFSYVAAWLSLVPQALCVSYVTLLWATREAEVALMFAGQLSCEALNFALKRLIKEERPKKMLGKGYGMPSSHAQFLAFFATYLGLFLLLRHRPATPSGDAAAARRRAAPLPLPSPRNQLRSMVAGALVLAAGVAGSRIYLHYHSPTQVLAGIGAGVAFGGVWYVIVGAARSQGLIHALLDTSLARQFRVRDLLCAEDLPEAGWRAWEAQRTARKGHRDKKQR